MSEKAKILATNLTASGYGAPYEEIIEILGKLTDEEITKLTYVLYRTAEKRGTEAFDCMDVYEY